MRRRRFVLAMVGTFTLANLAAQMPDGCNGDAESPPICEAYWQYDAVFVGQIGAWPFIPAMASSLVKVERAWKGVEPGEIEVQRGPGPVRSGWLHLPQGARYVILANWRGGQLTLGDCDSRQWKLGTKEADEVLAFLEGLQKPSSGARIFGKVSLAIPRFHERAGDLVLPMRGAVVNLTGAQSRTVRTIGGRYEIADLPVGIYELSVTVAEEMPQVFSARVPEGHDRLEAAGPNYQPALVRTITIPDLHACSYAPFVGAFDGGITGTVLNADKTPAEGIAVEVLPTGSNRRAPFTAPATAVTDEDGRYRVGGLIEGRYIVGINLRDEMTANAPYATTFYRLIGDEEPTIVTLGRDEQVDLGPLYLPAKSPLRRIRGVLKTEDGGSLDGVRLRIHDAARNLSDDGGSKSVYVICDDEKSGAFHGYGFEGRTYYIHAGGLDGRPDTSGTVTVTIRGDIDGLVIVLRQLMPD